MTDRGGIENTLPRLMARLRASAPRPESAAAMGARLDSVTARQWLWGSGFVTPGGRREVLDLAAPLKLAPGMILLDVAAGIGGAVRALAEEFRIEAVGLERDLDLARLGMTLSEEHRVARRAPVGVYDPDSFDLPPARHDCVLAREATHLVREKERFWRVVMQGLRTGGALVATEFVRSGEGGEGDALEAWASSVARRPLLWSQERYEDCFKSLGFTVSAIADITAEYRALVLSGWTRLMQRPELHRLPRRAFGPIIDEAERSLRLVRALDAGALRLIRLHAVAR
jgi:SAM-dependent methyltransferase